MDDNEKKQDGLFRKNSIYFRWGLTAFLVIVACVITAQIVFKLPAIAAWFRSLLRVLSPVFYGLGIAYLLDPIVERVERLLEPRFSKRIKTPGRALTLARGLGIFVALIIAALLVWALVSMVLPQLIESISAIVGSLPEYYDTVSTWVTNIIDDNLEMANFTEEVMEKIYDYLEHFLTSSVLPYLTNLMSTLTSSVVGMIKGLFNLIIGIIISVYLLSGKDKFLGQAKKLCYAALGTEKGGVVSNVCTYANRVFGGFIGGKIVDSAIIGVLCFIGLSVLKMPYTMLISIIVGVTNVIPVFGPYMGAIPSAVLLLVIDPIKCLTFVIFILILQQLDGNIIGPMILGDATGLGSFWVVVSILIFGSFYGVLGMVLGVPLFAVIYKIVKELVDRKLKKRGLSTFTEDYVAWDYPPRKDAARWNPQTRRQKTKAKRRRLLQRKAAAEDASEAPESVSSTKTGEE